MTEEETYKKRFRPVRRIGNSYYVKLESADIKDYKIKYEEVRDWRVLIEISDIIKLKKKSK